MTDTQTAIVAIIFVASVSIAAIGALYVRWDALLNNLGV